MKFDTFCTIRTLHAPMTLRSNHPDFAIARYREMHGDRRTFKLCRTCLQRQEPNLDDAAPSLLVIPICGVGEYLVAWEVYWKKSLGIIGASDAFGIDEAEREAIRKVRASKFMKRAKLALCVYCLDVVRPCDVDGHMTDGGELVMDDRDNQPEIDLRWRHD